MPKTPRIPDPPAPEAGQGAVEWLIALPVLLLLLGGGLQFGLVFVSKNTLDYANFKAVRAATLDHGSISAFRTGFAEGITPLFPSGSGIQGYGQALIKATATVNNSADLQIKVLNPTAAVLAKGGWVETVLRENGQSVQEIPNSRLIYASTGTTHAGETLQAANLLKIRTTYCYPLWVPYISAVIGQLMAHSGSSWDQQCYQNNLEKAVTVRQGLGKPRVAPMVFG